MDLNFDGQRCPCCDQFVKIYNRRITSSMAYALVLIKKHFDANGDDWLHVMNYLSKLDIPTAVKGGDFAKLKYWDLLEAKEGVREDGSQRVGYWRITKKGEDFVKGLIVLPKYARIYNQKFLGFAGDLISINQCFKKGFNYKELMEAKNGQECL